MAEVHDCFTPTELVLMEDLGFSPRGQAWKEVLEGSFDLTGDLPVNTDGGLKSFGHPVGASGLRMLYEVWLQLRRQPYTPLVFKTPVLYRYVRHPLYVGWFFAFWSTPTMTVAHLVFALATTAYILIAIQLEERDLIAEHPEYAQYRKRVPMLVPFTKSA